jgi:hypothetical protein
MRFLQTEEAGMTIFRGAIAMFAGLSALLLASVAVSAADYQAYRDGACKPFTQCGINFTEVPADRVVRIDNVSCYVRFSTGIALQAVQLVLANVNGSRAMAITLSAHYQGRVVTGPNINDIHQVFTSNDKVRVVAGPLQFFRAYAQTSQSDGSVGTINQLACHISGTIAPVPAKN